MYYFIKKNQKKMLAIFAAGLMVVFILPTTYKSNLTRHERVVAHVGKTPIYGDEKAQAEEQWNLLSSPGNQQMTASILGRGLFSEINGEPEYQVKPHPELFLLLQIEARQRGFTVPDSEVNAFLQNVDSPYADRYRSAI